MSEIDRVATMIGDFVRQAGSVRADDLTDLSPCIATACYGDEEFMWQAVMRAFGMGLVGIDREENPDGSFVVHLTAASRRR